MTPHQVYFDCDPGVDDCIALMAALGSPGEIDLLGVGVVAGNVAVDVCLQNAANVLALAGRSDVQLYRGCPAPILVPPQQAAHIHGDSGLGDAELPMAPVMAHGHAVDGLCALLHAAAPESVTVVVTGPMTNVALALIRDPEIAAGIRQIVVMGGARAAGGNITASAEFNIYADPHAAHVVLNCGRPIVMIGLDATLQLRCTAQRFAWMRDSEHFAVAIAADMIAYVNRVYGELYGSDGAALHDPCTVAYLLAPELFVSQPAQVDVAIDNGLTRGHTAVDLRPGESRPANVSWVTALDAPSVFALLMDRIECL